jgi:hypothetical protein
MSERCPLCIIPTKETLLFENELIYLVSTKDQKGHKVRVMSVIKCHSSTPTFEEQVLADGLLFEYMTRLMGKEDWYIVSNQFASIPQHWHRIAVDFPLEEEEDPLFAQTPKVVFPIRRK